MRKIGLLIPVWNQEKFIRQHIMMMKPYVDKIVIIFQQSPLDAYDKEHGYGKEKDRTEEIVKSISGVEYYDGFYTGHFGCGLFNQGLKYIQDMDIVIKTDPDIIFTESDLKEFIKYIKETEYSAYYINYMEESVNYYITNRFDVGLFDALEKKELFAFNPKKQLEGVLDYNVNEKEKTMFKLGKRWIHHLRGWKKSYPEGWENTELALSLRKEFNNDKYYQAPKEIIEQYAKYTN